MDAAKWEKMAMSRNLRGATVAFLVYLLAFIFTGAAIVITVEYASLDVYTLQAAAVRLWQCVVGVSILWSLIFFPAIILQKTSIIGDSIEFTSFFVKKKIHLSSIIESNVFSWFLFSGLEIKEKNGKMLTILFYELKNDSAGSSGNAVL